VGSRSFESSVADFARVVGLFVRRMRSIAPAAANDLSWTQRSVIARLAKDGAQTTAELARAEGVKPQSMGTAIAGLEALGIIERAPHPSDGRQVIIALTTSGAALRRVARDAKHTWLCQSIARLDKADQATLFAAAEVLERLVAP